MHKATALLLLTAVVVATSAQAGETIEYRYDAKGRLTNVLHTGTVNSGASASYGYDPADNRSTVTVTNAGAVDTEVARRVVVLPLPGLPVLIVPLP